MRVEYSDLSKKDFENLQDYLFDHWGVLVLENFLDKYDQAIQMLLQKMYTLKNIEIQGL
ncbi:hypothetical protein QWT87_08050 [Chryseobacterium sp. APV1]|uniref:Type II toxin-antitoxin system RelE/ParE family toxin n=1 Tax=Chryseobacterium urinae TaxID=3058400 RepID=A0ABT8U1A2_9FLAO|nr:hypothetical protein [Chryseobacterium sp. APV1]MDO3424841.1 hypothetical protein [Chryseobacterium sp. APV1]